MIYVSCYLLFSCVILDVFQFDSNTFGDWSRINLKFDWTIRLSDTSFAFITIIEQKLSKQEKSTDAAALRASLLTFQGQVYALDNSWSVYGLGHDYKVNVQDIGKAATLHYNGYLKPWLELGIPKYKAHWKKFLDREDLFLSKCNINP